MKDPLANFSDGRADMSLLMTSVVKGFPLSEAIMQAVVHKALEILISVHPAGTQNARGVDVSGKYVYRAGLRMKSIGAIIKMAAVNASQLRTVIYAYASGMGTQPNEDVTITFDSQPDRLAGVYRALRSAGLGDVVDQLVVERNSVGNGAASHGPNGKPHSNGNGKPLDSA